ncbi:MAG: redox-sensing transcriptional repressor Rex, partial [Clostridia bacterium]|nr:redox-sensing transcriptional repressor Rex [Clostridia bacterium]
AVSGAGRAKVGYEVTDLIESLEGVLGLNNYTSAVLVGAGKLGRALFEYDGFEAYGVRIVAAFDSDEELVRLTETKEILPMEMFETFCREHHVQIGIITVDEHSAQDVCDRMVKSGITAIWNFVPCSLNVPSDVLIQHEKLELSLALLSNELSSFLLETNGK